MASKSGESDDPRLRAATDAVVERLLNDPSTSAADLASAAVRAADQAAELEAFRQHRAVATQGQRLVTITLVSVVVALVVVLLVLLIAEL